MTAHDSGLVHRTIDTGDAECPYPVAAARQALSQLGPGQRLLLVTRDPHTALDLEAFCARTGHVLERAETAALPHRFTLRARDAD